MPNYQTKKGDVAYRLVQITAGGEPPFVDIPESLKQINYNADNHVLEVKRADGSTELFYEGRNVKGAYSSVGNKIRISSDLPLNRLWIRKINIMGMEYKIPANLPKEGSNYILIVPGGANNAELFGDKYFNMKYDI